MDEMTLTRELGRETELPSAERLAPARARLLAELTAAGSAPHPSPRPSVRSGRRPLTRRVLALAAAVTAVAAVGATTMHRPARDTAPVAMVPVAQFFDTDAAVAAQGQDVVPRGDQFVYGKTVDADGTWHESWYSVDGEHDGLSRSSQGSPEVIPGCADGRQKGSDSAGRTVQVPCEPDAHFRPDLPTDPAALIAVLAKRGQPANVNGIAKDLWSLGDGYWLRPAQRAALYRAAGMIDGISLVPGAKDSAGRSGTGVAWTSPGASEPQVMWIFDEKTHTLLGSPNSATVTPPHIVDRPGQRP